MVTTNTTQNAENVTYIGLISEKECVLKYEQFKDDSV